MSSGSATLETRPRGTRRSGARWLRSVLQRRLRGLRYGRIEISDPWGEWSIGDPAAAACRVAVHDPVFYRRLALAGSNGAAAAYRDGHWSCDDLTGLLTLLIRNHAQMDAIENGWARLGNWWLHRRHRARSNTAANSRANIQAHYDLDNRLFALFLDPSLTYSAGLFETEHSSLEQASLAKLDRVCQKLCLTPDDHVLEIGTGWGSFALHAAANYGCRVTSATISEQQYRLASERVTAAGLGDRVELLLRDYRELRGRYDKLVSIEMIEAVGHEFLPEYFRHCAALLKPDGQMLLQAITLADRHHPKYLKTSDFIQQYIFPGGCLPSLSSMLAAISTATDLRVSHLEDIGPHYATTLRRWRENFFAAEAEVRALGYRADFIRLWEFYLCYCEAGLAERYLGTVQLLLDKPEWRGAPLIGRLG